jgi:hypothetical protein
MSPHVNNVQAEMMTGYVQNRDVILRPQSGVVFNAVGRINNANSAWYHLYRVPHLHGLPMPKMPSLCQSLQEVLEHWDDDNETNQTLVQGQGHVPKPNYLTQQCVNYQSLVPQIWSQLSLLQHDILNNVQAIETLLENSEILTSGTGSGNKRHKRGIFNFISDITHSLFGIARDKDIQKFQISLQKVQEAVLENVDNIETITGTLQSYSAQVDEQFKGIIEHTNKLSDYYGKLNRRVETTYQKLNSRLIRLENAYLIHGKLITETLQYGFQRVTLFQSYVNLLHERLNAVDSLVNHNLLSPLLINPNEIQKLFSQIEQYLRGHYPKFRVAINDTSFIFRTPGIVYTWDNTYLYLQLRIPLASYDSLYHIYRPTALTLPLSVNHTNSFTKVQNLPELFAVGINQDFYFELREYEFMQCKGKTEKYCLTSFPVISNDVATCISSIYFNQLQNIKLHCKVQYIQTNEPEQLLEPIGSHKYLSITQKDDIWYLTCGQKGPRSVTPVLFGYFTLNCDCSLRTRKYFIPANIDGCHLGTNNDLEYTSINNLLYLIKYLDVSQMADLSPTKNAIFKDQVVYPTMFPVENKPGYVQNTPSLVLNLEDVIAKTRTSRKLGHELLDDMSNQIEHAHQHNYRDKIIMIVIGVVLFCVATLSLILCKKLDLVKKLIVPLLTTNAPAVADAFKLDTWDHKQSCLCSQVDFVHVVSWIGVSYLCVHLLKLILMYMYRLYKWLVYTRYILGDNIPATLEVLLEINRGMKTLYLPLTRLYMTPGNLMLEDATVQLTWHRESTWLQPKLQINWMNTMLTHVPTNKIISLPGKIPVPVCSKRLINKLMNDPLTEYSLMAGTLGKYTYVPGL